MPRSCFKYNGGCVVESFLVVGLRFGVGAVGVSSPLCLGFYVLPVEEMFFFLCV